MISHVVQHRHVPTAPWVLRTELGGTRDQAQAHADKLRAQGYEAVVVEIRVVHDPEHFDGDGI